MSPWGSETWTVVGCLREAHDEAGGLLVAGDAFGKGEGGSSGVNAVPRESPFGTASRGTAVARPIPSMRTMGTTVAEVCWARQPAVREGCGGRVSAQRLLYFVAVQHCRG